jgi:hypothetical protein
MPAVYGVPTDGSGAELLPWSWAVEQLEAARNYWVVTTRKDGRPHAAPVWGLWLDDAVWFSTSLQSQKGLNIAGDPRVVIHLEGGDDTVILEGEVERFVEAYQKKYAYRPELSDQNQGIFVLRPQVAQTWTESNFPRTATRWVFS